MKLNLIGYPISPFVRKCRVVLNHKGISYLNDPIVPYTEREKIMALTPSGTVPVLVKDDGSANITESADIVYWAEEIIPTPRVIPESDAMKQKALEVQTFADTQMAQVFGGMMFGQRLIVPYYFKKPQGNESLVSQAMNELAPQILNNLTNALGDDEYFAGEFSVGDIAASSWIRGAQLVGFELDGSRWPAIEAWLNRCFQQKGFDEAIDYENTLDPVIWAKNKYSN